MANTCTTSNDLMMKGVAFAQARNFPAAANAFSQAKDVNPRNVQAWRNLGAALKHIGAPPKQRIECYEQALRLEDDPYTYANLAAALLDAGDWPRAASIAQKACDLLPDYFVAWLNLGHALAFSGDTAGAQAAYESALAIDQQNSDALHGLGALLQQLNQYEEAALVLGNAEKISPDKHKIGVLAIRARQQIGDWSCRNGDEAKIKTWLAQDRIGIPPFNTLALDSLSGIEHRKAASLHAAAEFQEMISSAVFWAGQSRKVTERRLRVGYLTADFRQHVIGRLMSPVLQASTKRQHDVYVYDIHPGGDSDYQAKIVAHVTAWKNVASLSWREAAAEIAADEVDVLVDMTGYTSFGRSGILAYRPCPIQVNFLGYPASMGNRRLVDYIIADEIVAPLEHTAHYAEELAWLSGSFLPPVMLENKLTVRQRGEFGLPHDALVLAAFHNGYKLTPAIFADWMWLLEQLPCAVLWLLAPSPEMQQRLSQAAEAAGVDPQRIIYYRGEGYAEYLGALALADLFLDAQPYGAGGTSRDVLLVGIPMVTALGDRLCGRMAASVCIDQGVPECVAPSRAEYRTHALALANNRALRNELKLRLVNQRPLARIRIDAYAQRLDELYHRLAAKSIPDVDMRPSKNSMPNESKESSLTPSMSKTFLHVGCGPKHKNATTKGFNTPDWSELRLDIDSSVSPDIIGTMTDMSGVVDGSVDAIFSSHNIEHLYPHEVPKAFAEFLRVLNDDGFLVVTCPDLQSVCALIADGKLLEPAYNSNAGPIAAVDILYGHRPSMARGNLYMAHRCGFTEQVLINTLRSMGFIAVVSTRRVAPFYDLFAIATKSAASEADLRALAALHFPG